uniref:E3 ubiquitin-protein ligase HEL1-like n=1 Tax=Paramormyrops kingsleyae TaxID=1676925 RepID=A0A3B3SSC1_9TELE|nr:E3 ubiquitin-protein ligase HEL1-like [Paramormyrops kingsleyae]
MNSRETQQQPLNTQASVGKITQLIRQLMEAKAGENTVPSPALRTASLDHVAQPGMVLELATPHRINRNPFLDSAHEVLDHPVVERSLGDHLGASYSLGPPVPWPGGVDRPGDYQTPPTGLSSPRIHSTYQSMEVHRDTASNSDKMTTQQELKRYNPWDRTLKFVNRRDDITLDDDPETLRAEMSCGHAVSPESLTAWCQSLLDKGQYKFTCPALKDGGNQKCGKEWPYQEVRKMAVLTDSEQRHFEERMAALAAANFHEYKSCPKCQSFVEREDLTNLNVHCTVCTAERGRTYEFCWQCLRQWKGPGPRSDRCNNKGCTNKDLDLLKKCSMTILPEVENVQCPSTRACPTCGVLIEHDKSGCKNIICSRCQKEFCFVCLKLTAECLETSSHYTPCSDGVAPRQTSMPTWKRN